MKELTEIRVNGTDIHLQDNLVRSSILPEKTAELNRNIIFKGNTVVEGPVFGNRIEVRQGPLEIQGAAFTQNELYVAGDAEGEITFKKCVGSANSIVSRGDKARLMFLADINAKSVALTNAFVAGSIYADDITLENCVVIGGVFATQDADIRNSMVGTFNAPSVRLSGINYLLLPSAFSVEPVSATPGTMLSISASPTSAPSTSSCPRPRIRARSLSTSQSTSFSRPSPTKKSPKCSAATR